jgi:hypothetical protein
LLAILLAVFPLPSWTGESVRPCATRSSSEMHTPGILCLVIGFISLGAKAQQVLYSHGSPSQYFTGATPSDRIETVFPNQNLQASGENVSLAIPSLNGFFAQFAPDLIDVDASFLVDWGVSDLGHRINIMGLNYEGSPIEYNQIGIGLMTLKSNKKFAGVTEDFALDNQVFLTGVVYQDPKHTGFYGQGNGLAGVTIRPSVGNSYAVTSSSGGYAIPMDPSQITSSFTLTASGPGLGADMQKRVSLDGNNNVKVDFVPDAIPTPITLSTEVPKNAVSGGAWARILVTRTANLQSVLNLKYELGGDAVNGVDYKC